MENKAEEPQYATMQTVVVERDRLLTILRENKTKHDALFDLALSGYWGNAKAELAKKEAELVQAIKVLKTDAATEFEKCYAKLDEKVSLKNYYGIPVHLDFNTTLNVAYPENHSQDYERAIKKVELTVYDKVRLTEQEFEKYVLNNWEWKNTFLATNMMLASGALYRKEYSVSNVAAQHFTTGCAQAYF